MHFKRKLDMNVSFLRASDTAKDIFGISPRVILLAEREKKRLGQIVSA